MSTEAQNIKRNGNLGLNTMEINKGTNFKYNGSMSRSKNERHHMNNQAIIDDKDSVDISDSNGQSDKKNSKISKNSASSQSSKERSSSVVFEHIVPNTVKKMWVMAESSNVKRDSKNIDNDYLKSGHRLSSKYGNFFISHDAAKESNAEVMRKIRDSNVSESPELPHAKSHWGIELKPVSDEITAHDAPRLKKVSNTQRPLSTALDDGFTSRKPLQSKNRAHSLDFLDQIDGNEKDYPSQLSVQQRKKNFENSLLSEDKSKQSDKYAILHTKVSLKSSIGDVDLRGKSRLFFQPPKADNINGSSSKVDEEDKKNSREPISLKDLLKQDENNLAVDVVESNNATSLVDKNNNAHGDSRKEIIEKPKTHTTKLFDQKLPVKSDEHKKDNNTVNGTVGLKNEYVNKEKDDISLKTSKLNGSITNNVSKVSKLAKSNQEQFIKNNNKSHPTEIHKQQVNYNKPEKSANKEDINIKSKQKHLGEVKAENFEKKKQSTYAISDNENKTATTQIQKESSNSNKNDVIKPIEKVVENDKPKLSTASIKTIKTEPKSKVESSTAVETKRVSNTNVRTDQIIPKSKNDSNAVVKSQVPNSSQKISNDYIQNDKNAHKSKIESSNAVLTKPVSNANIRTDNAQKSKVESTSNAVVTKSVPNANIRTDNTQKLKVESTSNAVITKPVPNANIRTDNAQQSKVESTSNAVVTKPVPNANIQTYNAQKSKVESTSNAVVTKPVPNANIRTDNALQSKVESTSNAVVTKQVPNSVQTISNDQPKQIVQQPSTQSFHSQEGITRRVGKLIIMTGDQRDQQLKEIERIKSGQAPSSVKLEPNASGMALTFMSNEVADDDEPLPPVPTIIFNEPLPKLKSNMSKKNKKKKINVNFKQDQLTTVYSYPSESSYLDEVDASGQFHKTEDAVYRERDRLANVGEPKVEPMENINFVTEGGDFNSFSNEESGSALLF